MNIKHIKNAFGFAFAAIFFVGCTDVESINDVDLNQTIKTDEYYAALRKWKKHRDFHKCSFGSTIGQELPLPVKIA